MEIVTLERCESTSTTLRQMEAQGKATHGTVVRALEQTHGRGQRGNCWEAEPGANLTFSVLTAPEPIPPSHHFLLSQTIALAIIDCLALHGIDGDHRLEVKWPNDIMVEDRKIAGILIENSLDTAGCIRRSIVGIGLNVNQTAFTPAAPNATSLALITGRSYPLDDMMSTLASVIEAGVDTLNRAVLSLGTDPDASLGITRRYHARLWRREGRHRWRDNGTGEAFTAAIQGVMPNGTLLLDTGGATRAFRFKEVTPL